MTRSAPNPSGRNGSDHPAWRSSEVRGMEFATGTSDVWTLGPMLLKMTALSCFGPVTSFSYTYTHVTSSSYANPVFPPPRTAAHDSRGERESSSYQVLWLLKTGQNLISAVRSFFGLKCTKSFGFVAVILNILNFKGDGIISLKNITVCSYACCRFERYCDPPTPPHTNPNPSPPIIGQRVCL